MSKIEDLIQELCPDGVEYKPIREIYTRVKGTPITAGKMKEISNPNGDIKIFAGGKNQIYAFEKDIPNANITRVPTVLVQSRGVIDVVYCDEPFTFKNEMWGYSTEEPIRVKFLFYYLKTVVPDLRQLSTGMGSLPQISLSATEKLLIPVPPIEVQEEIVRVLDSFAELETRRRQYAYYRDKLLDVNKDEIELHISNSNYNYLRLMDIVSVERGKRVVRKELSESIGFPVYQNSLKPLGYYEESNQEANTVYIIGAGAAGEIGYSAVEFWAADDCYPLVCGKAILPRYLYHWLLSKQQILKTNVRKASIPRLSRSVIERMNIVLPPLSEQQRIVDILDKFDALVNDISKGLPAEIEARRKQYEYYRDKLLTFKKKED